MKEMDCARRELAKKMEVVKNVVILVNLVLPRSARDAH